MKQLSRYQLSVTGIGCAVFALELLSCTAPLGLIIWDTYLGDTLYAAIASLALAFG
jgi:hypothetical protein